MKLKEFLKVLRESDENKVHVVNMEDKQFIESNHDANLDHEIALITYEEDGMIVLVVSEERALKLRNRLGGKVCEPEL